LSNTKRGEHPEDYSSENGRMIEFPSRSMIVTSHEPSQPGPTLPTAGALAAPMDAKGHLFQAPHVVFACAGSPHSRFARVSVPALEPES
jgi:hypothetical protein